jgi:hypothetical protein
MDHLNFFFEPLVVVKLGTLNSPNSSKGNCGFRYSRILYKFGFGALFDGNYPLERTMSPQATLGRWQN